MTAPDREAALADLVDQLATQWETDGRMRMGGLILGQLMLGPKRLQSQADLARDLHVSVAAISGACRQLRDWGLIERISVRGSRTGYYRIAPHAWLRVLDKSLPGLTRYRELGEQALELVSEEDDASRESVEEMRDYMAFLEREIPALIEKFTETRRGGTPSKS